MNLNTIQYGLTNKVDFNLKERKNSKENSAITTPYENELHVKKMKENNNYLNHTNQQNISNSINNTIYTNTQTKSGLISQIHDLSSTHIPDKINLYDNFYTNINLTKTNSNNNSSNKISKTGHSQIKISSHKNSNINIASALNTLHNNSNNNNISNLNYRTSVNLSGNNSKEKLIKSEYNNNNYNNNQIYNNTNNVNINLTAAKSNLKNNNHNNLNLMDFNGNLKEISSTTKKTIIQNSKPLKNNYILNSHNNAINAKADFNCNIINKIKSENKKENKSGKVDRIIKPDSSKVSKDKKDSSNYNKMVIFSNNYNPKILKERVFFTKQPTTKNSRKTSNDKNAEKIISFYTNSLHTNSKPIAKSSLLSSDNNDKNNIVNLNSLNKDNNLSNDKFNVQPNHNFNTTSQKKSIINANSAFNSQNYLINTSNNFNLRKMHGSMQSSLEKAKPIDYIKIKNIGNPKVDYSLVNTEENNNEKSNHLNPKF